MKFLVKSKARNQNLLTQLNFAALGAKAFTHTHGRGKSDTISTNVNGEIFEIKLKDVKKFKTSLSTNMEVVRKVKLWNRKKYNKIFFRNDHQKMYVRSTNKKEIFLLFMKNKKIKAIES